ncbi:ribbon-helix-helix domain-containing protein [Acidianus brierleyi]|uniref:CopG family transcriptional regulator n=1 Tax=Acidianus brierleyi TaxID=41673 RepID=A0A2U9IIP3_9CREN|nr:ribbon-helix-helix domain-containing protein [Acidianus brierleyi]AWR95912.1 ribbon-helix-helix protein, CopG family [Acidianus brierleyi]
MYEVKKLKDNTYEINLDGIRTISFKLEEDMIKEIEIACKKLGYKNKSELIKDAIKEYLNYLSNH